MRIEHRHSIRKKIPFSILLNRGFTYSKRWKVRDLSLDGVLLEMNDTGLAPGSPVEAVLTLKEGDGMDLHRVPAYVARVGPDGLALRFRDYEDRTYTALVNLLYTR